MMIFLMLWEETGGCLVYVCIYNGLSYINYSMLPCCLSALRRMMLTRECLSCVTSGIFYINYSINLTQCSEEKESR